MRLNIRLWRLRPDFVKIDRSVTASAVRETHARLVLANMVKLIHECGAEAIIEGIETRDEALTAPSRASTAGAGKRASGSFRSTPTRWSCSSVRVPLLPVNSTRRG